MKTEQLDAIRILPEIAQALECGEPVVALESTVITHGLPAPANFELACAMEQEIRQRGVLPATIAVLDGVVRVGVERSELERLASLPQSHKISARDLGPATALGWSGGTTVAGTLAVAGLVGLRVFATGGIGGVHREPAYDVSADLSLLSGTPVIVVCAGAKAILDLDATLEYLETHSVPVIGYQTDEFPAFYSRSSGLKTSCRADTPEQAAAICRQHWSLGFQSAVLVAAPPPEESALEREQVESAIERALEEANQKQVRGQAMTPFLLERMNQLTGGASLRANLDLLKNNARIAAAIARAL